MPDLYYCIPAYNEENNIEDCLNSLNLQDLNLTVETIVCLNGCSDKTEKKILKSKKNFSKLNIKIIHSKKGKTFAQNEIVRNIKEKNKPLVFIDADTKLDKTCIRLLFETLKETKKLIVVGSWPIPLKPSKISLFQKFFYRILHIRAFYPEAEISVNNVSAYKDYTYKSPQPTMSPEFEMHSKLYFHGRTFMMRNSTFFYLPEDPDIADDTFLPNFIHTKFGPGTIRTRFDAIVYYKPYLSLKEHYTAYKRVFWDLDNLDRKKEFIESRKLEKTKLNWKFIFSQGPFVTFEFFIYILIFFGEKVIYKVLPKKTLSEVWQYEKK